MTRRRVPDDEVMRQRFGRLLVVWEAEPMYSSGVARRQWVCRCDCGSVVTVPQTSLRGGMTRSCGCLTKDVAKRRAWGEQITGDDILAVEAEQRAAEARQWEVWFGRMSGAEGGGRPVLPPGIPADAFERADDAGGARRDRVDVSRRAQEVHVAGGSAGD